MKKTLNTFRLMIFIVGQILLISSCDLTGPQGPAGDQGQNGYSDKLIILTFVSSQLFIGASISGTEIFISGTKSQIYKFNISNYPGINKITLVACISFSASRNVEFVYFPRFVIKA